MIDLVMPTDFDDVEIREFPPIEGGSIYGIVISKGDRYTAVRFLAEPTQRDIDRIAMKSRWAFARAEKANA